MLYSDPNIFCEMGPVVVSGLGLKGKSILWFGLRASEGTLENLSPKPKFMSYGRFDD